MKQNLMENFEKRVFRNIWAERNYPLVLMLPVVEATIFGFSEIFRPSRFTVGGNYWLNGMSNYFYEDRETKATVDTLIKQSLKNSTFFYKTAEEALSRAIKLRKFTDKNFCLNLKKVNTNKLLKQADYFYKEFKNFYTYASFQSTVGYRDDSYLYVTADKILRKKTKNNPEKFADFFQILTSPQKRLRTQDFELDVLRLAFKCQKNKLKKSKDILKKYNKELKLLEKKYKYLSFDFNFSIKWDLNYFSEIILEKYNLNIKEEIKKNINYEIQAKINFLRAKKDLFLIKSEIKIFELVRDLGYYKWAREFEFQKVWYDFCQVLDELGDRLGLNKQQNKYLLPEEYILAFADVNKNKFFYKKITQERIKNCLIIVSLKSGTNIYMGKEAQQMHSQLNFVKDRVNTKVDKIKGMPARRGFTKGRVIIVNTTSDMKKVRGGDILVSIATYPKLLPAMKKSAAIITDEGGITCHAAIASRELGIPCIVGTKVATQILHNGDLVEVDANQGIIKKLKYEN